MSSGVAVSESTVSYEDLPEQHAMHRGQTKRSGNRFYRPELDALRFFAFLAVFVSHSLIRVGNDEPAALQSSRLRILAAGGSFGVCIFFLLSAYLITELLRRELFDTGSIHLSSFYLRRILRIWPLYFGIQLIYVVAGMHSPAFRIETGRLIANALMVGNWYIFFHPAIQTPLRHLWSISVEEQYYLLWPVMVVILGLRRIRWVSVAIILTAIVTVAMVSQTRSYLSVKIWVDSLVQFQFFAIGTLIALSLNGTIPKLHWGVRVAGIAAGILCWTAASGFFHIRLPEDRGTVIWMVVGYELMAIGTTVLFLCVLGIASEAVDQKLAYLGKISYGLYVFHETGLLLAWMAIRLGYRIGLPTTIHNSWTLFVVERGLGLILTVVISGLSYQYFERPFLKLKSKFVFVGSRPV